MKSPQTPQKEAKIKEEGFKEFREKVFGAFLKKSQGIRLSSNDYKLIKIWRELGEN